MVADRLRHYAELARAFGAAPSGDVPRPTPDGAPVASAQTHQQTISTRRSPDPVEPGGIDAG
jgi:hypothetical protein